jgi:hypothetical protein
MRRERKRGEETGRRRRRKGRAWRRQTRGQRRCKGGGGFLLPPVHAASGLYESLERRPWPSNF